MDHILLNVVAQLTEVRVHESYLPFRDQLGFRVRWDRWTSHWPSHHWVFLCQYRHPDVWNKIRDWGRGKSTAEATVCLRNISQNGFAFQRQYFEILKSYRIMRANGQFPSQTERVCLVLWRILASEKCRNNLPNPVSGPISGSFGSTDVKSKRPIYHAKSNK